MANPKQARDEFREDVFLQDNRRLSIANHATKCERLIKEYMNNPDMVPEPTIMEEQQARFTLWTSNMDVHGSINVSLDYRLRHSATATDITHQLLDVICNTLLSCDYFPHTIGQGSS
jgi:hypothetical protein